MGQQLENQGNLSQISRKPNATLSRFSLGTAALDNTLRSGGANRSTSSDFLAHSGPAKSLHILRSGDHLHTQAK